jgi:hypothetical protein
VQWPGFVNRPDCSAIHGLFACGLHPVCREICNRDKANENGRLGVRLLPGLMGPRLAIERFAVLRSASRSVF